MISCGVSEVWGFGKKKLGCKPGENRYIINELGVGYRMLDPQE